MSFKKRNEDDLKNLKVCYETLDLKDYYGKTEELDHKISNLVGVWVVGGNCFVLRQAMYLSGFDKILPNLERENFLYSGFSAGICVLSKSLNPLTLVDDIREFPYRKFKTEMRQGLEFANYTFLPHFRSNHPESGRIKAAVNYCMFRKIKFKTLEDGDVLMGQDISEISELQI